MRRVGLLVCFLVMTTLACNLGSPAVPPTSLPSPSAAALTITSTAPVVLSTSTPIPATTSPSLTACTVRTDWPIYTVATGDTLGDLAVRTGSTTPDLAQANCLSDANSIYPGQQLHVPRQPVGEPSTRRIQFAPGSSSGSVSGSLRQPQSFILNARAGQHMTVSIALVGGGFTEIMGLVIDPAGGQTPAALGPSGVFYDGLLPASGDYTIRVNASSQVPNASFVLTVVVTNSASLCPTPSPSSETVGTIQVVPAQVISTGCESVKAGTPVVVSWPEVPQGASQVTFYFNTPTMSKADVIGVDSNLADGAAIPWTVSGRAGSQGTLYALAEGPAAHSAVWSGGITLVILPANP